MLLVALCSTHFKRPLQMFEYCAVAISLEVAIEFFAGASVPARYQRTWRLGLEIQIQAR